MIEYSLDNPAHQVYLGVKDSSHATVADPRNEATGVAGALVKRTLNGGFGTGFDIENQTLGDGVYRVYLRWTTGADNSTPDYNIRAGNYSQVSGHSINIHRAVYTENPAAGAQVSKAVTLAIADSVAPTVSNCTLISFADADNPSMYRATINCDTTELGGDYFVMLKDTNAAPADSDVVIAGTGAFRSATGPVDSMSISAEFTGLSYQDLWAYVVHRDAATNKSTVATATFDATNKALQLGTVADPIMRGSVPLPSATYATVTIYSGNKAIDPTATVVTALQNVPVVNGVATGREEHVIPGQPSLNSIPNGTYWVLSSRPSGATYALSYGQRAIVTE